MAQAQAQSQDISQINQTESLEMVRCLLRVSIFHISYLRGLFPDKHFKSMNIDNLDMSIKMLRPICEESQRLTQWVEEGVYEAIKKQYLQNLMFGISTNADGTSLLEQYIFSFSYDDSGRINMDIKAPQKKKFASKVAKEPVGLASLKYQICRLMRMLVQICQTLDMVPGERFLNMKLTYHDNTPDDYEPPFFKQHDASSSHFVSKPFGLQVGDVSTNYHAVSLKIKSVLDSTNAECGDEVADEGRDSTVAGMDTTDDESQGVRYAQPENASDLPALAEEVTGELTKSSKSGQGLPDADKVRSEVSEGALMETSNISKRGKAGLAEIRTFCQQRTAITLTELMAAYDSMTVKQLERAVSDLVKVGVLCQTEDRDTFKVTSIDAEKENQDPLPTPEQGHHAIASQLKSLNMQSDDAPGSNKRRMHEAASLDARMESNAGSSTTESSMHAMQPVPRSQNRCLADDAAFAPQVCFQSQQSQQDPTALKASFVEDPIHQNNKRARTITRASSRLQSMK
ncbi:hypothetical protein WJX74_009356 [Apatococcus lobatus]|uniref:HORMA domain-containing protein n=1 Tax=Apatococcus lobatus TaxID=904363 RepID=A0AAW1RT28_9CHLO